MTPLLAVQLPRQGADTPPTSHKALVDQGTSLPWGQPAMRTAKATSQPGVPTASHQLLPQA